jgi:hypothetical protein
VGFPAAHLEGQAAGLLGEVYGIGVDGRRTYAGQPSPLEKGWLGQGQMVVEDEAGGHKHDPAAGQTVECPDGQGGRRDA